MTYYSSRGTKKDEKKQNKMGGLFSKMIPNCKGCREDLETALVFQQSGYFLATTPNDRLSYPNAKNHFCPIIVNKKGMVVVQ